MSKIPLICSLTPAREAGTEPLGHSPSSEQLINALRALYQDRIEIIAASFSPLDSNPQFALQGVIQAHQSLNNVDRSKSILVMLPTTSPKRVSPLKSSAIEGASLHCACLLMPDQTIVFIDTREGQQAPQAFLMMLRKGLTLKMPGASGQPSLLKLSPISPENKPILYMNIANKMVQPEDSAYWMLYSTVMWLETQQRDFLDQWMEPSRTPVAALQDALPELTSIHSPDLFTVDEWKTLIEKQGVAFVDDNHRALEFKEDKPPCYVRTIEAVDEAMFARDLAHFTVQHDAETDRTMCYLIPFNDGKPRALVMRVQGDQKNVAVMIAEHDENFLPHLHSALAQAYAGQMLSQTIQVHPPNEDIILVRNALSLLLYPEPPENQNDAPELQQLWRDAFTLKLEKLSADDPAISEHIRTLLLTLHRRLVLLSNAQKRYGLTQADLTALLQLRDYHTIAREQISAFEFPLETLLNQCSIEQLEGFCFALNNAEELATAIEDKVQLAEARIDEWEASINQEIAAFDNDYYAWAWHYGSKALSLAYNSTFVPIGKLLGEWLVAIIPERFTTRHYLPYAGQALGGLITYSSGSYGFLRMLTLNAFVYAMLMRKGQSTWAQPRWLIRIGGLALATLEAVFSLAPQRLIDAVLGSMGALLGSEIVHRLHPQENNQVNVHHRGLLVLASIFGYMGGQKLSRSMTSAYNQHYLCAHLDSMMHDILNIHEHDPQVLDSQCTQFFYDFFFNHGVRVRTTWSDNEASTFESDCHAYVDNPFRLFNRGGYIQCDTTTELHHKPLPTGATP